MNQWPLDSILEMQEQNDSVGTDSADFLAVLEKTKWPLYQFEKGLILVLPLQLVRQDNKIPTMFPEASPEIVID